MGGSSVFTTERLAARRWAPADLDAAYDIYSRWEVARFLGSTPAVVETPAAMAERLARWSQPHPRWEPVYGFWALTLRASGAVIGAIMLHPLPDGTGGDLPEVEIGWHLHPDHWGHGYATEAGRAALRRGFGEAGLAEVYAVVYPDNAASQAVCRRLGMTHLGRSDRFYGIEAEVFLATRDVSAGKPHA